MGHSAGFFAAGKRLQHTATNVTCGACSGHDPALWVGDQGRVRVPRDMGYVRVQGGRCSNRMFIRGGQTEGCSEGLPVLGGLSCTGACCAGSPH